MFCRVLTQPVSGRVEIRELCCGTGVGEGGVGVGEIEG